MQRITLAFLALTPLACGSVDRTTAVNKAADATCSHFKKCDEFGDGKKYKEESDCQTDYKKTFNDLWSSDKAACKEIESKDLDICIKGIESTLCDNFLDTLNTAVNKCSADTVCGK